MVLHAVLKLYLGTMLSCNLTIILTYVYNDAHALACIRALRPDGCIPRCCIHYSVTVMEFRVHVFYQNAVPYSAI